MCTNAMSIARRHLGIIVRLCDMSEQDEPVAELVRAHGGEIKLVPGTIGATFSIAIPDAAVDLDKRRGERASA